MVRPTCQNALSARSRCSGPSTATCAPLNWSRSHEAPFGAVADKVRSLTDRGDTRAGLMMVRYFNDEGGYRALGWSLTPVQIALLARMGASIDADEYDGDFTAHQS